MQPCKLKPGRGHTAEEVAASQRARIHQALIELVAERGYDDVTVLEVTRAAGVSKRAFYEHFAGKEGCFLATYDLIQRRVAKRVMAAYRSGGDWQERLFLGVEAFAAEIVREPRAARLAHIESFAVGPAALERIQHAATLFAAMIKESFDRAPDGITVPPPLLRGIVSGLAGHTRARLLEGRERELPGDLHEVMEWTLGFRSEAAAGLARLGESSPVAPAGLAPSLAAPLPGDGPADRELILAATAELAAERGYGQLSVPAIRTTAGVSRQSFDANFADPQDCFVAILELMTERTIALAEQEGTAAGPNWAGGIHRALCALCAHAVRDPALARLAFVEVFAPGIAGIRHRDRLTGMIATRFRAGVPPAHRPSDLAAAASLAAVWGVVHHYVVGDRVSRLARLAPTLSFLVLVPTLGASGAAEAIGAEQARIDAEARPPLLRPYRNL